jgi:hypothetical protein
MLAFAIVFSLLLESLPAARAEEKNFGATPSLLKSAAENQTPPDLSEGTVWSDMDWGLYGWISVNITWDDMPERNGLPTFNADRTFYLGDAFRVQITGSRTEWYEDRVACWGSSVEYRDIGIGREFDQNVDLQIPSDAEPGLYDINFAFVPKTGYLDITAVDENGNATRNIYIDNTLAGTGNATTNMTQGTYTVSFEENPPENVVRPSPTTVTLTPARRLRIVAHYEYENAEFSARTEVHTEENGAPEFLPAITATLRIRVVPYRPKFAVIPYLLLNWEGGTPQYSYDIPSAALVRYDGNQFDPENENRLSLAQRALTDGISVSGGVSWQLLSHGRQQRHHDNGSPAFNDNGDPVMYEDLEPLRDDNGALKLATAEMWGRAPASRPALGSAPHTERLGFSSQYHEPENLWENVYTPFKDVFEKSEYAAGSYYFGTLKIHDTEIDPASLRIGGEDVFEFLTAEEKPIFFDENHRYHKFVFSLQPSDVSSLLDPDAYQIKSLVSTGKGTLGLNISLWSVAAGGLSFSTGAEWGPLGLVQPVAVHAWRLAPWAREQVENDPQVLYFDNAWAVDERVGFEVKFIPVYSAENFMLIARNFAENAAPALQDLFGSPENLEETLLPVLENLGIDLPSFQKIVPAAQSALYSLSSIDDYMMNTIIEDIGWENEEPQLISGRGEAHATVERRGLSVFAVEERAWTEGENAQVRSEMLDLPFDNEREFAFDINLSGEGMAVEVASDISSRLELCVHAPPRSGGLQSVRILDNQGRLLFQRDFLPPALSQLSVFGAFGMGTPSGTESPQTIILQKTPATPTEIYVELTNHWGASSVRKLSILPWAPAEGAGLSLWGWLIAAGVFIAVWVAFVNWLKERRIREHISS